MKIFNFRDTFACNSSSTHSVVIIGDAKYNDKDIGIYQWNEFCCSSPQAKFNYFLAQLASSLNDIVPNEYVQDIISGKYNDRKFIDSCEDECSDIDHQSKLLIPTTKQSYSDFYVLDNEFLKDLEEFLLKDNVVIFGGNDNDEEAGHNLTSDEKEINLLTDKGDASNFKARKDGNIWTIMSRWSGWKTRFSFNDSVEEYNKSSLPELVDIKIISTCNNAKQKYPAGCVKYCYQSSCADGKYVSVDDFRNIVYRLQSMDVFEIALGGGEPMDHPDILQLLSICRNHDIIPNITTRNYDWLDDKEKAKQIFEMVGQIAFSVSNSMDVQQVALQRLKWQQYYNKFVIQHVIETETEYTFKSMLETIKVLSIPIIFLGFKTTGNGIGFKSNNYCKDYEKYNVIKSIQEIGLRHFGVDTAFIQKYEDDIKKLKVSPKLYYCDEGKFSFYIDAVEKTYGKSSYSEEMFSLLKMPGKLVTLISSEDIIKRYSQW